MFRLLGQLLRLELEGLLCAGLEFKFVAEILWVVLAEFQLGQLLNPIHPHIPAFLALPLPMVLPVPVPVPFPIIVQQQGFLIT